VRSKTTLTVTILGGVAALALTGCSNPGGTASPITGASTTTATSSADKVSNPLDTTKLQQNLCSGLTPAQLAPYMGQVGTSSPVNQSDYTGCNLHPADINMASVAITVYPKLGPSALIATSGNYPYAKQLSPIQGYTAQDTSTATPPNGICSTAAAVSDHVSVEVQVQVGKTSQYYNNTCAASEALLPLLLDNIKASG
jgi:hypothetical protein